MDYLWSNCAFTRTPIRNGEPALMALFNPDIQSHTSISTTSYIYRTALQSRKTDGDRYFPELPTSPICYAAIGTYNHGCGGHLENIQFEFGQIPGSLPFGFFVHLGLVELLISFPINQENFIEVVLKLMDIAFDARIQLFCDHSVGDMQFFSSKEFLIRETIHKFEAEIIQRIHNDYQQT